MKQRSYMKIPNKVSTAKTPKVGASSASGGFFVEKRQINHPDRSQVRSGRIEPQVKILGLGPFEGFVGEFSVARDSLVFFLAQYQVEGRKEDDRGKESKDGHLCLEQGNLSEIPIVDCGVDVGNGIVQGLWIVQIGNRG
jgi:hypothetical protein